MAPGELGALGRLCTPKRDRGRAPARFLRPQEPLRFEALVVPSLPRSGARGRGGNELSPSLIMAQTLVVKYVFFSVFFLNISFFLYSF